LAKSRAAEALLQRSAGGIAIAAATPDRAEADKYEDRIPKTRTSH